MNLQRYAQENKQDSTTNETKMQMLTNIAQKHILLTRRGGNKLQPSFSYHSGTLTLGVYTWSYSLKR